MKNILRFILVLLALHSNYSQTLKGKIVSTANNITIVKVWGNHYERGYAQGFLLGDKIDSIYQNYIIFKFGTTLWSLAKNVMHDSTNFKIDSVFMREAVGVVDGMKARGINQYDSLDVIAANSFLDLISFSGLPPPAHNFNLGCSCLMSWGNATSGLGGKSVISRHLDWEVDPYLYNNQVMVIHIPAENDEQPWIMIGFAGQISVLSGTNQSGLSACQHVLHGTFRRSSLGMRYEPIWFSVRKALEKQDFNHDGKNNTNDIRDALLANPQGYSASCIITSCAPSTQVYDSLIALVSEVTHVSPTHSFRSSSVSDSIPGNNLYAANNAISAIDTAWYYDRYRSVVRALGSGQNIDSLKNWTIMRDSSRVSGNNIQFIQVIPELKILKLSVYSNATVAYANNPVWYRLDTLFTSPLGVKNSSELFTSLHFLLEQNFPNPFNPSTIISFTIPESGGSTLPVKTTLKIFDVLGNEVATLVDEEKPTGHYNYELRIRNYELPSGIYFYRLRAGNFVDTKKMIILK